MPVTATGGCIAARWPPGGSKCCPWVPEARAEGVPLSDVPRIELTSLPGISSSITAANDRLREFAETDDAVIIHGEHGTEKAFAAKIVHLLSPRASRSLARITVSWNLPGDTAARFRVCDGGTLIVNLQRDFTSEMQYALLEMANDGVYNDPGAGIIESDARLIITTSLDLEGLRREGSLLPEISDMLARRSILIPPVRERKEDITALVRYAIERARETGRTVAEGADAQVLALFRQLEWHGNAEDLLLVTAEAALNTRQRLVCLDDLPEQFVAGVPEAVLENAREVKLPTSAPPALRRDSRDSVPKPGPAHARPGTRPQDDEEEAARRKRLDRLSTLVRRLRAQAEILHSSSSKPRPGKSSPTASGDIPTGAADLTDDLLDVFERDLGEGLDAILAIRRLVAQFNKREQEALLTARDIYRRLLLAGMDKRDMGEELHSETGDMATSLQSLDAVLQRLSETFPGLSEELTSQIADSLRAEEKNVIEEAVLTAKRRTLEEEQRRSQQVPRLSDGTASQAPDAPGLPDEDTR